MLSEPAEPNAQTDQKQEDDTTASLADGDTATQDTQQGQTLPGGSAAGNDASSEASSTPVQQQAGTRQTSANESIQQSPEALRDLARWQRSLLPFMMAMLSLLAVFFLVTSLVQLSHLEKDPVSQGPPDLQAALSLPTAHPLTQPSSLIDYTRWKTLAVLEANALQHRYYEAAVALRGRLWIVYLGFLTGMILALVGATFVLGRLHEAATKISIDPFQAPLHGPAPARSMSSLMLETSSPGIVLAGLGVALMLATLLSRVDIQVNDLPSYVRAWSPSYSTTSGSTKIGPLSSIESGQR